MKKMPRTSPERTAKWVICPVELLVCSLSFSTSLLYCSWEFGYTHSFNLHRHIFLSGDGTVLLSILAKSNTHFQN